MSEPKTNSKVLAAVTARQSVAIYERRSAPGHVNGHDDKHPCVLVKAWGVFSGTKI
jgi:hypothetical protein